MLSGARVIEWGNTISAAYCGRLLRDAGAQVEKVEPPQGDAMRRHGPFRQDRENPEASGMFAYLNSGKDNCCLDPADADAEELHARLQHADVFVTSYPLTMRRQLGLDAAAVRARHPHLIYVSISVFGDSGPLSQVPAQAIDAYAASGVAWVIGEPGRVPLLVPGQQADYQAGAHAAAATLSSLVYSRRTRDGKARPGNTIDIAAADVMAVAVGTNAQVYLFHGDERWERAGRRAFGSGGAYPYVILPCKDGHVCLLGRARHEWDRLMDAMGNPPWSKEPRYNDLHVMGKEYPEEVDELIKPWLATRTRSELLDIAQAKGFPLAPLRTMQEVVASEQFRFRGYFQELPTPDGGTVVVPGSPWKIVGERSVAPVGAPGLPSRVHGSAQRGATA